MIENFYKLWLKSFLILFCLIAVSVNAKPISILNRDWDRPTYTGRAFIIDGDTLKINGIKIRLAGVDAPEISQKCKIRGHIENCGEIVKLRLVQATSNEDITCYGHGKDYFGRVLAECYVNDININKWLLREGLAVYYYNKDFRSYKILETLAKQERNGLWDSEFQNPKEYRRQQKRKRRKQ
jgi:endonuclease YncB( thermonuclease family)